MADCAHCGARLADDEQVCRSCGTARSDSAEVSPIMSPVKSSDRAPAADHPGMAVAGFVLGIVGILFFITGPLGIALSVLGIIFSSLGLRSRRRVLAGWGLGLSVGAILLAFAIIGFGVAVVGHHAGS